MSQRISLTLAELEEAEFALRQYVATRDMLIGGEGSDDDAAATAAAERAHDKVLRALYKEADAQ